MHEQYSLSKKCGYVRNNMLQFNNYQRSVLLIILGGIFLSTLGLGVRLVESADSFQITFYRACSQAVLMTFVLWLRNRGEFIGAFRHGGYIGSLAGLMFAGASIFLVLALTNTAIANAMFVMSLAPFMSALLAWVVLKERVSRATIIAICVAVLGVSIMINGALSGDGLLGIAYAMVMVLFYASFTVCLRMIGAGDNIVAACWGSYLVLLILGFGMADMRISDHDLIICLLLGVFQLGLGGICIVLGAKYVPAAQIALLAMLEPVLSPIWVWLGVGEVPSVTTLIGGVLIFSAIAYQALASKR